MVFVQIPIEPYVAYGADKKDFEEVKRILSRHGYAMASFEHDNVVFYDIKSINEDRRISLADRYSMSRKSFTAFIGVLKKLDQADQKLCDMVIRLNTSRNVG